MYRINHAKKVLLTLYFLLFIKYIKFFKFNIKNNKKWIKLGLKLEKV